MIVILVVIILFILSLHNESFVSKNNKYGEGVRDFSRKKDHKYNPYEIRYQNDNDIFSIYLKGYELDYQFPITML